MPTLPSTATAPRGGVPQGRGVLPAERGRTLRPGRDAPDAALQRWLRVQGINITRHVTSLRPFRIDEFGTGPAAPSEAHISAVNRFLDGFRERLLEGARSVEAAVDASQRTPTTEMLNLVLNRKEQHGLSVLYVEGMWDFYFDLFVQRLSSFGERLRTIDRIAMNCYQDLYLGMGTAQPTPRLMPFSYATTGFSPATYRRGVPMSRLRRHKNLFPLITLPQHRLDNPWAMSSVLHEVSHNLQADVGLWEVMPGLVRTRLVQAGIPEGVALVWARWHKETMADLLALLLGGPPAVESLMDVVGRSRSSTARFSATAVHPTPVLRVPISIALLRRLGLGSFADSIDMAWRRLYPGLVDDEVPTLIRSTFPKAVEIVIDTMVFTPHRQFGNKSAVELLPLSADRVALMREAGRRLAAGTDIGAVPLRYMVSAARFAIDQSLATPEVIATNFYRLLGNR